jgi:DNA replication protein DnaC
MNLGMRKLPDTAAEDLLELVMRRYERASTLFTSNRPVEDWGKPLGDSATVAAMLDRLLHHAHVIQFCPDPPTVDGPCPSFDCSPLK